MKNSEQVLHSVLKTAQMGQVGLGSVLQMKLQQSLAGELRTELAEYDNAEKQARETAALRGWQLSGLGPGIRKMAGFMVRSKLRFGDRDSRAAAMVIHGNVRGMIKGCRNRNAWDGTDRTVEELSRQLLRIEQRSSENMQRFL